MARWLQVLLCRNRCCSMPDCVERSPFRCSVQGAWARNSAIPLRKLSMGLLRRCGRGVFRCVCILGVVGSLLAVVFFLRFVSKAAPHWVETCGERHYVMRLVEGDCFGVQSPSLVRWFHLAVHCLHLQLLRCQALHPVLSFRCQFESGVGVPVYFPEGMVSGLPTSRINLLTFFVK